jgi:protein gp37
VSSIEWTDETWNPVIGCTRVSPGCDHCYIERTPPFRMAGNRFLLDGEPSHAVGSTTGVMVRPDRLATPLRWRKPRRVFVNSLSDLFHARVSDEFIAEVWAVMGVTPWHTYQVLTKRPGRMRAMLSRDSWFDAVERAAERLDLDAARIPDGPLPNVWGGVSVETQQWADVRIPLLVATPLAVRFLSCEPLLGPVGINDLLWTGDIDWVIVGGESGPGARPMHPNWARSLRDQCTAAGVPFFFKQWGEWAPAEWKPERWPSENDVRADSVGATHAHTGNRLPDGTYYLYEPPHRPSSSERRPGGDHAGIRRVGKRAAGRELDGRTWDEYPRTVGATP